MASNVTRIHPLVFPAAGTHTATVFFLHGLGDSGQGWAVAVENWRLRDYLREVKFILPNAPQISITANWGMQTSGWFDIASIDGSLESLRQSEDEHGIVRTQRYIHELIQGEIDAGIPAERIMLGGFSQGGAISLFAGLTAPFRLAGIAALSAWLPLTLKFEQFRPDPDFNRETPIRMFHGDADTVVNPELGSLSCEKLKELGYDVDLKVYGGLTHSATLEELDDIYEFIRERLPPSEGVESGKSEL